MPIQPQVIETNADAITANRFTFEIVGLNLKSPNFTNITLGAKTVDKVEIPDGGTGLMRGYHGGVMRVEDSSIVRISDGTENDRLMHQFFADFIATGVKRDANVVKRHHGRILKNIEMFGVFPVSEAFPAYDNATAAGEEITYTLNNDWYDVIF